MSLESSLPRASSVQSACTRATGEGLSSKSFVSGAAAAALCRSTSSRCAVRRHQRFGLANCFTSSSSEALPR